jgi:hypothetical protein
MWEFDPEKPQKLHSDKGLLRPYPTCDGSSWSENNFRLGALVPVFRPGFGLKNHGRCFGRIDGWRNDSFPQRMIHRETSRVLVLHLLWQPRGAKHRCELLRLDIAFVLIEGHPTRNGNFHNRRSAAQLERDLIRERVTAGIRNARANGKQLGRPKRTVDREEILKLKPPCGRAS